MDENGRGVAQDDAEAVARCRKAADEGDAAAQCSLAVLYQSGKGVARDPKEALRWFLQSAEQGYAEAQLALGNWFTSDDYPYWPRDRTKAISYFLKAAEQGYVPAQVRLGQWYANGGGDEPPDIEKARAWMQKAAEAGSEAAKGWLTKFTEPLRQGVDDQPLRRTYYAVVVDQLWDAHGWQEDGGRKTVPVSAGSLAEAKEIAARDIEKEESGPWRTVVVMWVDPDGITHYPDRR